MIKEFAVEPSVMADWSHFRVLWDDFGVARGRLISRYPKTWNKEVYELAQKQNVGPVKASTICERIRQGANRFVPSRRDYAPTITWIENATGQMAARPFHAIVAEKNPASHAAVLVADDLDREDARYKVCAGQKIARNAAALAGCANLLILESEEIRIIDPYFDPSNNRFVETFEEVMSARRTSPVVFRVCELHTRKPDVFVRNALESNYRRRLERLVPAGLTLKVHLWSQKSWGENLHPRFLVTERGGIQFDYGFDQGGGGDETTWVTLMTEEMHRAVLADYSLNSTTFAITPECVIDVPGRG